jgi:hypothetical protein
MTCFNSLSTFFKSAYYVPIAFCRFFTWIALGDVCVCFSLFLGTKKVNFAEGTKMNLVFEGMTVTSFFPSFLKKIRVAKDRMCQVTLKLLCTKRNHRTQDLPVYIVILMWGMEQKLCVLFLK